MTAAFHALMFLVMASAIAAGAWFGRGWYDGTLIQRSDADLIAQARIDEAVKWQTKIQDATDAKQAALNSVNAAPRIVSRTCPPGTGAASDDAVKRLRAAVNSKK